MARQQLSVSLIDIEAWNQAGWLGVGFFGFPDKSAPPLMALIFRNASAARRIFEGWRRRVGETDVFEELRVAVIEGSFPGIPDGYAVHINANVQGVLAHERARGNNLKPEMVYTLGRVHHVERGSPGLVTFKQEYAQVRAYDLVPAIAEGDSTTPPRRLRELPIRKHEIVLSRADQVNQGDFDWVAMERPR